MITVTLNQSERDVLYRQEQASKDDGGWQRLLVTLQELTDESNGELTILPIVLERIQRYAFSYGKGGWEDRLKAIFERTLGPGLDGNI